MLAGLLSLVTLAAGWVDTSRGPACLDAARLQSAVEGRVGPRAQGEQVVVERLTGDDVRVSFRRGAALVAVRELHVDAASCGAAERSIALLVAAWWKLPISSATESPLSPRRGEGRGEGAVEPRREPAALVPSPALPNVEPPAEPAPHPDSVSPAPPPSPAPIDEPAPPPAAIVPAVAPEAAPPSPWRWSAGADGVFTFDGHAGWAGMLRGAAGLRDGFGASLDLGIEGQRLGRDTTGLLAVTPWFGTLSADWEHRFSAVHLELGFGARLYAFAARSFAYDVNYSPVTWAPALAARIAVRVPLWRGLYVTAGVTGGARLREEAFSIRGADATVTVPPWFGQGTLGLGVGSQ